MSTIDSSSNSPADGIPVINTVHITIHRIFEVAVCMKICVTVHVTVGITIRLQRILLQPLDLPVSFRRTRKACLNTCNAVALEAPIKATANELG